MRQAALHLRRRAQHCWEHHQVQLRRGLRVGRTGGLHPAVPEIRVQHRRSTRGRDLRVQREGAVGPGGQGVQGHRLQVHPLHRREGGERRRRLHVRLRVQMGLGEPEVRGHQLPIIL